jgi:hypothetical protein
MKLPPITQYRISMLQHVLFKIHYLSNVKAQNYMQAIESKTGRMKQQEEQCWPIYTCEYYENPQ